MADAPAVAGIVFGVATIANDSLQDLKTGQLVGAAPGKRQVAPAIGVAFGLVIVPPVPNTSSGGDLGFAGRARGGPRAWARSRPRA
ncbi:OPT/YSL family transporter [Methylobacterium oryzae CBMB20]